MLRVFSNEKKGTTTAIVENCETDAIRHIDKIYSATAGVYETPRLYDAVMATKYTGTVTCREGDEFNAKLGEGLAVKKAMDNHNNGFKKAIVRWQALMIKDIMQVSPETFEEALHKVHKCNCNK